MNVKFPRPFLLILLIVCVMFPQGVRNHGLPQFSVPCLSKQRFIIFLTSLFVPVLLPVRSLRTLLAIITDFTCLPFLFSTFRTAKKSVGMRTDIEVNFSLDDVFLFGTGFSCSNSCKNDNFG